jgi:hypothetical protein
MPAPSDYVEAIYTATFFRRPTQNELDFWTDEIDNGFITPSALGWLGVAQPQFITSLQIAQLYTTAFEIPMTTDEMLLWGRAHATGSTLSQIANQFIASQSFKDRFASASNVEEIVSTLYEDAVGTFITNDLLSDYMLLVQNGDPASVLLDIASQINPVSLGLELFYTALHDDRSASFDRASYNTDAKLALGEVFQEYENTYTAPPVDTSGVYEANNTLVISSTHESDISINLANGAITDTDGAVALDSGDLVNVTSVDARDKGIGSVSVLGNSTLESVYLSAQGDSVEAGSGDNTLYLNSGSDTIVFGSTPTNNGLDMIYNFARGASGDVLDFSKFLNAPNSSLASSAVDAWSSSEVAWQNGDILVAYGNGLTDATAVAAIFGPGMGFAAPSVSSKNVLITADIVGDAQIWYIINQQDRTNITVDEITLVGQLEDINNLQLVGFDSANFA